MHTLPAGLLFNGVVPHAVEAFEGERWSCVFFTMSTDRKVSTLTRDTLIDLGFPLPPALTGPRNGRFGLYYQ